MSPTFLTSTVIVSLPCELALEQFLGQRIFDEVLDRPTQRPGAEVGVRALLDQELLGFVGELELQALLLEPLADLAQLEIDDVLQVVVVQVAEDDDVVHAVEELGPEDLFDLARSRGLFMFS